MAQLEFDDDAARRIDRTYATPDVVAQRARTLELLDPRPGERVLDVGSGPGHLLAAIAGLVGPDGEACGVDPSAAMNGIAAAKIASQPWARVELGDALALPGGGFDAAVSTQVYEYVPDLPAAFAELARVLRPGGRVLILDTDWDGVVWHVADRARHARVMAAWEEHLAHPRLPRVLAPLLRAAGFTVTAQHAVPILNTALHEDTYSCPTMSLIAAFVAGRRGITSDEAEAWVADLRERDACGEYFFCLNRYCVLATLTSGGGS
ncbi:methyltransferase domain-containing protein [Pseudonocardia sp.]|uniref:methyltransferase domain-containing protein n=1 Tax=Pseudonocardia sp. TaxID=60912 RepID=UPI003D0CB1DA